MDRRYTDRRKCRSVTHHLREYILRQAFKTYAPNPRECIESEISWEFLELRLNRKILGAMRYGRMGDSTKPQYDRISCMIRRLESYRDDLNAEHLIDVANLAELEFVEGEHKGVIATDDGEHHTEKVESR